MSKDRGIPIEAEHIEQDNPSSYRWVIAGAFCVVNGIAWGTTQGSFGVFVNPLTEDMGWSRTAVSAAFSTLLTISFTLGVLWGWLSDRWSVRGVITLCGALLGSGFLLASNAHAMWQFYFFYSVIGGIGLAGIFPALLGLTTRWFYKNRGLAIGIGLAGVGVATAVLPLMAEQIISLNGWRTAFQTFGMAIWAGILVGAILLKKPQGTTSLRNHSSFGSNPLGKHLRHGPNSCVNDAQYHQASDGAAPVLAVMRTRSFWCMFGMLLSGVSILQMILVHLVPRAIDGGVTSSTAATLLPVLGFLSIVGKVAGGALGDRIGPRRVYIASIFLQALLLFWLTTATQLWEFYLFAAAFGLSYGGWGTQPAAMAARIFGSNHMGSIIGALSLGAAAGGLLGPTMAGYIFDTTGSYTIAFNLSAGIAIAGIVLSIIVKDLPPGRTSKAPSPSQV